MTEKNNEIELNNSINDNNLNIDEKKQIIIPNNNLNDENIENAKAKYKEEENSNKRLNEHHETDYVLTIDYSLKNFHKLGLNIHNHNKIEKNKNKIIVYLLVILTYIGVQFGLLGLNFQTQEYIEENYYYPFHVLEFWAVFIFTILESFILMTAEVLTTEGCLNIIQTSLSLFNIVSSLSCAILFNTFPAFYEVPAHYLEYSIQILITALNFIFIFQKNSNGKYLYETSLFLFIFQMIFAIITLVFSIIQLLIFKGTIHTALEPERAAHFIEFSIEAANGLFALWYGFNTYNKFLEELKVCSQKMKTRDAELEELMNTENRKNTYQQVNAEKRN